MKLSILILGLLFVAVSVRAHDSNPSYKYSEEANRHQEDEILEEDIVDLPASRGSHHGHSHGGHGHSHEGHGHSHGGHGHSHGGHKAPDVTPEERERMRKNLHSIWNDQDEAEGLSGLGAWGGALLSTLLVSAAPFFILFFIPLDNGEEKKWILKILLSFASGGLMGDAFLHLIPHAMMATNDGHGHGHGHSHGGGDEPHSHDLSVGLGVLSGIIAFLAVEKFVRIMNGGHGHSHSLPEKKGDKKDGKKDQGFEDEKKVKGSKDEKKVKGSKDENKEDKKSDKDASDDEDKKKKKKAAKSDDSHEETADTDDRIKVAGYLNLAADCFHNFTDGLAIGASFHAGEAVGIVTTLTILLHEIPHEIGDFAILIQSGVPRTKAIFLQLLTAVGAMAGCVVSLLAGGVGDVASAYILPFTAGGFIYIATVSVIPELLEGKTSFKQSVMEIFAMLLGVGMMVIIAQYE